ncbi:MAG: hypothetical protein IT567_02790 [Alphaproteobacteria bacterium]|nr:hypothetical protein [Alphaproteobacteria bacterium]
MSEFDDSLEDLDLDMDKIERFIADNFDDDFHEIAGLSDEPRHGLDNIGKPQVDKGKGWTPE